MFNYKKVFTGNFTEVQRIFKEFEVLNVCAIIRDKSRSLASQSCQIILVHKDESERAKLIIKQLTSNHQSTNLVKL